MVIQIENWRLKNAEKVRQSITRKQLREIKSMYENLYIDISKQIANEKDIINKQRLTLLQRDINSRVKQLNQDIQNHIVRDIRTISNEVVQDKRSYLKQCGFEEKDIVNAFFYVPENVVQNITTGNIYQKGWTLSKAIWGYNKKTQKTLSNIISYGTAQQKSAYDIAKEIEQYVKPSAKKPSRTIHKWRYARQTDVDAGRANSVGEKIKDTFYIGRVDYNAQRLARTMVSHAYEQSFMAVNEHDPFVMGYRWLTSNFHGRVCDICRERAETDQYGLGAGVFPKDELPLDHPNGMCTFEAVIPDSMTTIADKIGKWYQSPSGTYPDIDNYVLDFM